MGPCTESDVVNGEEIAMYTCCRLGLAALLFLVAATLSVACSEGDGTLPPVVPSTVPPPAEATTPVGASNAMLATTTPTETPVPVTSVTATPEAATSPPAAEERRKPGGGITVRASGSSSAPSVSLLRGADRFNLSPLGQFAGGTGGLTVSAIGSVTVPADEAYIIVVPEQRFGSSGPEQMSSEDRKDIKEKLAGLGIDEDTVEFVSLRGYGPASISVELETAEVLEMGPQVVDAVEEVVRRSESHGVRYTLSDENCDRALSLARRQAIPNAEKAAADLAQAFGVGVGSVTAILEYPLNGVTWNFPGFDADSCGTQSVVPYASLVPFDSEQELEISVGLQVTYSIQ